MEDVYSRRKLLRRLEKAWSRLEILINRLTGEDFNPLYHLDTLGIYLLIVLTVTGIYLTIFYRPGADVAYATVEGISSGFFGSLMRSIHRYGSDLFLLVVLLHALKTLLSDRFWGSRWVAWVTGWAMVIISWAIGTMGYWLIWDQRSQWMTEVLLNSMGGRVALTFLNPEMAATSFAAFVIILFIHIFFPLALLGLIILHVVRLARARVWSPRWVIYLSTAALAILSIVKPAVSEAPADLSRFIEFVRLDAWYLGFLPLLDTFGNTGFWLLTLGVFGFSIGLPWLAKGRQNGPAVIHAAECTGCALCATECPYRAIEMQYREDDTSRFKSIAVISADLCTGCGLCVGTCATLGIELVGMQTEKLYEEGLLEAVKQRVRQEDSPVVVFTCQRQVSLSGLPAELLEEPFGEPAAAGGAPIRIGKWKQNGRAIPAVSCILPCLGMADVDWIKALNKLGAREVMLLGCPYDDCNYREGPRWEAARLLRRKSILAPNIQWRTAGPGDPKPIPEMFALSMVPAETREKPALPDVRERKRRLPKLPAAGIALAIFSLLAALALPLDFPSRAALAGESQLRLVLEHPGVIDESLERSGVDLPESATVELEQILGGSRFPVALRLWVDGGMILEERYIGRGARNEGEVIGMALHTLPPGSYEVEIEIDDADAGWRTVFSETVSLGPSEIATLVFDEAEDRFILIDPDG